MPGGWRLAVIVVIANADHPRDGVAVDDHAEDAAPPCALERHDNVTAVAEFFPAASISIFSHKKPPIEIDPPFRGVPVPKHYA